MTRRVGVVVALLAPAMAVCLSAFARGPSEEDDSAERLRKAAAAREDVVRLADSLDRDEDEIERQAFAIADKHDLASVMAALQPYRPEASMRLAKVAFAVSRAAALYVPKYTVPGALRTPKGWGRSANDMRAAAEDLIDALKRDDRKAAMKAVADLNHSCRDCHGAVRER
jgi:hypothetical protein